MEQRVRTTQPPLLSPWLAGGIALFYLGLLALPIFIPGQSLLDRLRWLDSGICAQMATHSFYPGGERLPLCARNTGIYLGFVVTLITLYATGRGRTQRLPSWPIVGVLIGGVVLMAIDGFNSFLLDLGLFHLYQPQNMLRLLTGLATGLAMGILIVPLLNRLLWCEYNEQRSVPSWKTLLLFIPALIICFIAITAQSGLILYPVALLSTLGILLALSSVNLIILTAIGRREQSFVYYRDLLPFFTIAFACSVGEMLALAQLKLLLLNALL